MEAADCWFKQGFLLVSGAMRFLTTVSVPTSQSMGNILWHIALGSQLRVNFFMSSYPSVLVLTSYEKRQESR
jgi:hypothetical protein